MISHKTEIRVRFCETDKMQFLHHAKYLEYFEVARTEFLRSVGLPYKELEDSGYELPVRESFVRYMKPAFYDDLLIVEASIEEHSTPRVHIEYKVTRKSDSVLIAEGYTDLVFVAAGTKKVCRPPGFYMNKFKETIKND